MLTFWAEITEEDDAVGCLRGKKMKGVIKTNPAGRREVLFRGRAVRRENLRVLRGEMRRWILAERVGG